MRIVEFPLVVIREGVAAALVVGCVTIVFLFSSPLVTSLPTSKSK